MRKWIFGIVAVLLIGLGIGWAMLDKNQRALIANLPKDQNVLFWTQDQRDAAFRTMETLVTARTIKADRVSLTLAEGKPLTLPLDVDAYMKAQRNAGLIIIQDGKIRFEKYGLGQTREGRWTSFSVAKSFTSTLVGAAIKDGKIKSLEDKVSAYIPDLKGSAYDDVTIRQLLTMTSGVKWNEDYTDRNSDVALFNKHVAEPGVDVTVSYMRKLPREAPAGSKWVYKTGETNLLGVLVSSATGKTLSDYLSEKVWLTNMETDGVWMLGSTGHEISGCCMSATLSDFARFGMFLMRDKGVVLPADWLAQATTRQADIGVPGKGYGFQWWTYDDGSFAAQGIFGQGIFIDPKRNLVIASNGDWPQATYDGKGLGADRENFYQAVQAAIDAEK